MRRAFTLVELLIVVAAAALLVAAVVPTLARARGDSGQITSMNNLQTLSFACAVYAWDFNDRQPTWIPDDAGLYVSQSGGSNWASAYISGGGGCPPQLILGWDSNPNPTIWGYFLGCGSFPGNSGNAPVYEPNTFTANNVFGSFRLLNAHMFSQYVDGRFYSETFFAPNDQKTWELAEPRFALTAEFTVPGGANPQLVTSSYAASPAAMWNPEVLAFNAATGGWFRSPNTFFDSYKSPSVSQCAYPELKTRIIEHNWNLGAPAPVNPAFAGGYTPYFFNSGIDATPLTLFFDGHVAELPNTQVVADDELVLRQTGGEVGLWTRDTPMGTNGYYGAQSYDGTLVSHHVLTANGILGRDVLYAAAPSKDARDGGVAGDHADRGPHGAAPGAAPTRRPRPLAPPGMAPIGAPLP
ncbi:MAG: prepilin-type N-terminal cleavage/methylation domain-containing protein [Phycisphaerales bacterium]